LPYRYLSPSSLLGAALYPGCGPATPLSPDTNHYFGGAACRFIVEDADAQTALDQAVGEIDSLILLLLLTLSGGRLALALPPAWLTPDEVIAVTLGDLAAAPADAAAYPEIWTNDVRPSDMGSDLDYAQFSAVAYNSTYNEYWWCGRATTIPAICRRSLPCAGIDQENLAKVWGRFSKSAFGGPCPSANRPTM
jgi:hypothetical protein